jgi:hypothetical protein
VAGVVSLVVLAAGVAGVMSATAAQAAVGCQVSYAISGQWPGGFGANVIVSNLGDAVTSWRLTWSFTAGQTVGQIWNATATQSGGAVTVTNVSYNGSVTSGGTVSFGFNGTWNNSSNPVPTTFALNGTACTGVVSTTGTTTRPPTSAPPTTLADLRTADHESPADVGAAHHDSADEPAV